MIQMLNYVSVLSRTELLLIVCLQEFIIHRYNMETRRNGYCCHIGTDGILYARKDFNVTKREPPVWLAFIGIFFSPRVMKTALKIGLAACLINRFDRFGFLIAFLCFPLY
jgi:hypothetical protein